MKAWKLWTLLVLLSMGVSCAGGGGLGSGGGGLDSGDGGLDSGGGGLDSKTCAANQTTCDTVCCDKATEVCNTSTKACEFGAASGECEGKAAASACADGHGLCYEGACKAPENVPCAIGGSFCEGEFYVCNAATGACEDTAQCRVGDSSKCGPNGTCMSIAESTQRGLPGVCYFPPKPQLGSVQFSNDCSTIELLGTSGIYASATFASSFGTVSTLCPEGVAGGEAGFRCSVNNSPTNPLVPGRHSAQWTVRDSFGAEGSSPGYSFQTTLSNVEAITFPLERLMPSAALGQAGMAGYQVLEAGNAYPTGVCWGSVTLRGSIATGMYHTCVLQADGAVRCWGLKNGAETDDYGQIAIPADLSPVVAIAAGKWHTCVLQAEGTVRCWGRDDFGQVTVPEDLGSAVAIAAHGYHTCALQEGGAVRCWGAKSGAYYDGQTTPPEDLGPVVAIAANVHHTCALQEGGAVRCWGLKGGTYYYGQTTPPKDLGPVVAIATGLYHSCAVQEGGKLSCWGIKNGSFSFDQGQTTVPGDLGPVVDVGAGTSYTCALQANGKVRCWGNSSLINIPANLEQVVALSVGDWHACALKADGTLYCWGYNNHGQRDTPLDLNAAIQTVGQLSIQ